MDELLHQSLALLRNKVPGFQRFMNEEITWDSMLFRQHVMPANEDKTY